MSQAKLVRLVFGLQRLSLTKSKTNSSWFIEELIQGWTQRLRMNQWYGPATTKSSPTIALASWTITLSQKKRTTEETLSKARLQWFLNWRQGQKHVKCHLIKWKIQLMINSTRLSSNTELTKACQSLNCQVQVFVLAIKAMVWQPQQGTKLAYKAAAITLKATKWRVRNRQQGLRQVRSDLRQELDVPLLVDLDLHQGSLD